MRTLSLVFFLCISLQLFGQNITTLFETSQGKKTPTYTDVIKWWQQLDAVSPLVKMQEMGGTDAGYPLHLVLISGDRDFNITSLKKKNRNIIFVLNGIHPGEPDGIDASMLLARDIHTGKYKLPSNVVVALIPVYNIGGALNRSAFYRVDQNGPEEFGFRGNSQNLDLNRDFIKCDSKEALSFTRIFRMLDPDVFIDNHVSNGADYQHVMTLITSQHNKLGGTMGSYLNKVFEPAIYDLMKKKGWDLVPYVNHFGETPDKGWTEFWDSPRYSSGYATLWNSFAFVPETHMLKPYDQRVHSTRDLMKSFIEFAGQNGNKITQLRREAKELVRTKTQFPLKWKIDMTQSTPINFKGYEAGKKPSEVSGLMRLWYDRNRPYEKTVPFYNTYVDTFSISRPKAYIIPQGWWKVIERLEANSVQMQRLTKDTTIEVEAYRITNYQSSPRPFESRRPNSNVQVTTSTKQIAFRKGDCLIPLNQAANRFIVEVLEPQAEDSYFTWNFFDAILGQKEGFSDYVFEETAANYLLQNPALKERLEQRKLADTAFAKSPQAQLNFVYQNSPFYEPAHMQYPVYRLR